MIFLACWWGRFIDWLEGHEPSAQVFVVLLPFLVTLVLVGVTAYYAKKTGDIARSAAQQSDAAREQAAASVEQAEASVKMAEAVLCPAVEQWIGDRIPLPDPDSKVRIEIKVNYQNSGAGPAVDIRWGLYSGDRRIDKHRRVAMGHRAEARQVEFDVDESVARSGLSVRAEYQDVLGVLWRSILPLDVETDGGRSYLVNGAPTFERIPERTIAEEGTP